ncbi:MAG TPA: phage holin family protein [Polyangiaceae bacterium]
MQNDDDPTRAALRVAESVVELVRAEAGLAAARARAAGSRLAVTLAFSAAAMYLSAVAVVVVVVAPVLWAYRPAAAIGSLAIALFLAAVATLVALKRWRAHAKTSTESTLPPVHHDFRGSDHAIPR